MLKPPGEFSGAGIETLFQGDRFSDVCRIQKEHA
jgi:hypothetical protein